MATQWEYKIVETLVSAGHNGPDQIEEFMAYINELGAQGWELVTDTIIYTKGWQTTQYPVVLFKRPTLHE
ncbi:DUF4177 domain-containing protein [Brevibacterium paucivorans]|uniref:DUF4177 domain-containing protein n=1 Tax=Brevibacterium paucivorans TaxID=170994 RepID=A0A2N6VML4_9MICO|nr:hypothetical protein CJ199_09195 [Brevibacterium paucivorans]